MYPQRYSGEYTSLKPESLFDSYTITEALRPSAEKIVLDIVEPNGVQATLTFTRQEGRFWNGHYRRRDGSDPERLQMYTLPYPDEEVEELALVMSRLGPEGKEEIGMAELTRNFPGDESASPHGGSS